MTFLFGSTVLRAIKLISTSELLRTAVGFLALVLAFYQVFFWLPEQANRTDFNRDIQIYYMSARHVVSHQPLYTSWLAYGPNLTPRSFYYPPQFAAAVSPLGYLSFRAFSWIWYALILIAFWGFSFSLARISTTTKPSLSSVGLWGLVLAASPGVYFVMCIGQVDPILWALFGLGISFKRSRYLTWTVAAQIKLYPVWMLAAKAFKEGPKFLIPCLAINAVWISLTCLICGASSFVLWFKDVPWVIGQGSFNSVNVSLSFAVLRVATLLGWKYTSGPLDPWIRTSLGAASIIGPVATGYICRRLPSTPFYAIVGLSAVLFSPLCWRHYLTIGWVLISYIVYRLRQEASRTTDN
jgi:hypothetical protein